MRLGPVGPRRHDRLEGTPVRTQAAHLHVEGQGDLALAGPFAEQRLHGVERQVGHPGRLGYPGHLPVVLLPAQLLDHAFGGDQLGMGEPVTLESTGAGPADMGGLEAETSDTGGGSSQRLPLGARVPDLEAGLHPGRLELLGRLRPVAAVGG